MRVSKLIQPCSRAFSGSSAHVLQGLKSFGVPTRYRHQVVRRASHLSASSALYEIAAAGEFLDTLFISGVSLSIAVNIGISALPLLVGVRDAEKLKQAVEDDTQDIKWGVMSLLSFFPLLNWLAWVFGALDDEQRAPIYYTNALVYLLPWLSRGFELDRFSIACLVAGVLHVQLERVAQTEPENFQLPSPGIVKAPLQQAARALTATARTYEGTLEEAVDVAEKKLLAGRQRGSEDVDDKDVQERQSRELKAWDERFEKGSEKERDNQ